MADIASPAPVASSTASAVPSAGGPEWDADLAEARKALLRSKGFVWMATSSAAGYFVSHAGQFLELVVLGRWWADIPEDQWPAGMKDEIKQDYDPTPGAKHGDRRQELVFIGQFGARGMEKSRKALEAMLDSCLLTPKEMKGYEAIVDAHQGAMMEMRDGELKEYFVKGPGAGDAVEGQEGDEGMIPDDSPDDEEEEEEEGSEGVDRVVTVEDEAEWNKPKEKKEK